MIENRLFDCKNAVFRVKLGDLLTHYGGATLALARRYVSLTDSITPNRHRIGQIPAPGAHPNGENSRRKVQNVVTNSTALIVRKPNSFTLQLRLENLVLFLDVRDHIKLMPVDPACPRHEKELPRLYCIHMPKSTSKNVGS